MFACERELETEQKLQYFDPHPYGRQRCVFHVLLMLNRRPWVPLCWVMAFFAASYQQLLWTPTQSGAPSPFGLVWLSLPHLVYNSVRSLTVWLLSWLSYIIVQRPLNRLLDHWNGMFDCHQAEITVMQFTCHSLPVHQSMRVPWEFFYFVPFHQPISAHAISCHNCHKNVSLLSSASPWNGIFGRVEGQNTTVLATSLCVCVCSDDDLKNYHHYIIKKMNFWFNVWEW